MSAKATLGITREFFDDDGNLTMPGPGLKLLDDLPGLEYRVFDEWIREIPPEHVHGCDMIISGGARWTAPALEGNEQLISLLYTGVGYDHIDVEALTANGTLFCFAPDAVRRPMACTVMTFILALAMRLMAKDRITRQGRWAEQSEYRGEGLTGKTLGGIGVGNIGREVFLLAQPFGMRHLAYDPFVDPASVADLGIELVDLDTLLPESDFVTISVPLSDNTRHLVGEQEIRKMKPTAYLINTSRGSTVDEQALIRALRENWIQGAGIDVFEQEPVDPDNPLLKMDNVIVSPHALGHTDEYYQLAWEGKVSQAAQILRGEIPHSVVNTELLESDTFKAKFERFKG